MFSSEFEPLGLGEIEEYPEYIDDSELELQRLMSELKER